MIFLKTRITDINFRSQFIIILKMSLVTNMIVPHFVLLVMVLCAAIFSIMAIGTISSTIWKVTLRNVFGVVKN